ncbi:MAG: SCP2 sterol-binding domain-containing protein [Alphaproteobacteria bacterium]|nr:SCP2 sterol-binding domain-containing protein [Alphaproteobacteria bacterium]MDP3082408.1 SCP2 sterol-binding domain-containing protein [Rubrivivax sp.]
MNHALPPPHAWHRTLQDRLRRVVLALPVQPPSFVAARLLDLALLPRLPADARRALAQRTVEIVVADLGLRLRLQLDDGGFRVAPAGAAVALRIVAPAASFVRLMRGEDDADRLFFERVLVMEGDTEMGLVLKNTLDAIGPLWPLPTAGAAR